MAPLEPTRAQHWQKHWADAAVRQVFLHLQQHGAVTEQALTQMLGSPRQVRRFARDFESYVQQVPFTVRMERTSSGKRYVRQSEGGAPHRPRQVLRTATIFAQSSHTTLLHWQHTEVCHSSGSGTSSV